MSSSYFPSTPLRTVSSPDTHSSSPPTTPGTPNQHTNGLHLPSIPHPHLPSLHMPRIPRPKLVRRHTEPANLKIECSSGPSRKTHSTLSTCTSHRRGTIKQHDVFVCSDGVNAERLLALSREALDSKVQCWGGNAMVDESWSYTIRQRKPAHGVSFKVSIKYSGVVAQCDRPDPHRPVALEEVKSVPGLMTVLSRE